MNTPETQDFVAASIMIGVIFMAVAVVATFGWLTVFNMPVNTGFADMAKFISGGLVTLAGVVLKDWMAKKA